MNLRHHNEATERLKLRVLQFLSEPIIVEDGGALKEEIMQAVDGRRSELRPRISLESLLPKMKNDGLVGRAEVPSSYDGKSKPYFITDAGRQYLEAAQHKAVFAEPGQRQDWAAREADPGVQVVIADFIRRLPEFQLHSEERIQQVSSGLAKSLSESLGQPR